MTDYAHRIIIHTHQDGGTLVGCAKDYAVLRFAVRPRKILMAFVPQFYAGRDLDRLVLSNAGAWAMARDACALCRLHLFIRKWLTLPVIDQARYQSLVGVVRGTVETQ